MNEIISFPTQGELIHYTFKVFGILPTKHDRSSEFDEVAKNSFQKLLARLKSESQAPLIPKHSKSLEIFDERLGHYLGDGNQREIILAVLSDVYTTYKRMVIEEGTYRPKLNTLLYFIVVRATGALVESVTFRGLHEHIYVRDHILPNLALFFPEISADGEVTWPLREVMHWVYDIMDLSQAQFHCPGKSAIAENPKQQNNLESAGMWVRDQATPYLPSLLANFEESLALHEKNRAIPAALKETMKLRLTLARVSTSICKDIAETYGIERLRQVIDTVKGYFKDIASEVDEFRQEMRISQNTLQLQNLPTPLWQHACSHYAGFFQGKKERAMYTLQRLRQDDPETPFEPFVIRKLSSDIGSYPVNLSVDMITRSAEWKPEPEFVEMLNKGFEMKRSSTTRIEEVDRFEQELVDLGLHDQLAWLPPWIRSACAYRADQFEQSWTHIHQAFNLGRYRAGGNQYLIVNQHLEQCAKTKRWTEFRTGFDWAKYAGIRIRWADSKKPHKDAMKDTYAMLGMSQLIYASL